MKLQKQEKNELQEVWSHVFEFLFDTRLQSRLLSVDQIKDSERCSPEAEVVGNLPLYQAERPTDFFDECTSSLSSCKKNLQKLAACSCPVRVAFVAFFGCMFLKFQATTAQSGSKTEFQHTFWDVKQTSSSV